MIDQVVKVLNVSPGSIILMLLAVVIILAGIWLILAYNRLTRARIRIDNSWSQVSVQLKMRADLVPNLVETVRGYARHEQETLNQVMETRSRYLSAQTSEGAIESSSELGSWVHRLLAVAEQYPDLKADANYRQLQTQLGEIEEKIALSRQFYNDAVMLYNRLVEIFPSRIVASLFGFEKKTYFEYEAKETDPPSVRFS
jgi:LemA protein